jgi:hypothetical protein
VARRHLGHSRAQPFGLEQTGDQLWPSCLNAVPVKFAQAIAEHLLNHMARQDAVEALDIYVSDSLGQIHHQWR